MNDLISLEKIAQRQKLKTLVLASVSSPITASPRPPLLYSLHKISGYDGARNKATRALRDFAGRYADQTDAVYFALLAAIKKGQINVAQTDG
jgi:hypothetical protein